jgi:hypothetical protein
MFLGYKHNGYHRKMPHRLQTMRANLCDEERCMGHCEALTVRRMRANLRYECTSDQTATRTTRSQPLQAPAYADLRTVWWRLERVGDQRNSRHDLSACPLSTQPRAVKSFNSPWHAPAEVPATHVMVFLGRL